MVRNHSDCCRNGVGSPPTAFTTWLMVPSTDVSCIIIAAMVMQLTSVDGTINQVVKAVGGEPTPFLQQSEWFRTIYVSSEVWQTVGWGQILYLAALTTL